VRHDELLAELTDTEQVYARETLYAALRAVVELHKPELIESGEESIFVCSTCNPEWFWENPYPCPTIQAIEKELG
jgi:rubrerythrin